MISFQIFYKILFFIEATLAYKFSIVYEYIFYEWHVMKFQIFLICQVNFQIRMYISCQNNEFKIGILKWAYSEQRTT